jgi:hypothetical protein
MRRWEEERKEREERTRRVGGRREEERRRQGDGRRRKGGGGERRRDSHSVMAVRSYVRPSPATTGSRMTQSEMGHKISSGSASPRLAAKAAAWSPGEEGGGGASYAGARRRRWSCGFDEGLGLWFRLRNVLRGGQSRMAWPTHPAASVGPRIDACGACDRCGEYPTGPRISPSPGTRAFAFGGELSAERVCLPEAYLRTPGTHRSYERALLYRMPNGVPHVIASTQHASLNQSDKINSIKSDVSNPICVYTQSELFLYYRINPNPICARTKSAAGNRTTQSHTFQSAEVLN